MHELSVEEKPIKYCFLGYTDLDTNEKLALVRKYHQGETDWTKNQSDEDMLRAIDEMVEFSKYVQKECAAFGIEYFDVSHNFDGARKQAFDYLFKN
jgi:hypothetical protein